jgi:hypothetical protein
MKKFLKFFGLALFFLVLAFLLFWELQFRKTVVLEGVIHGCWYADAQVACSYIASDKGNFLLTEGTLDKVREGELIETFYDKKVRLLGRISRQKLAVRDLGTINRFQIERLEFIAP